MTARKKLGSGSTTQTEVTRQRILRDQNRQTVEVAAFQSYLD